MKERRGNNIDTWATGDTVLLIWEPSIVAAFQNTKEDRFTTPEAVFTETEYFSSDPAKLRDLAQKMQEKREEGKSTTPVLQDALWKPLFAANYFGTFSVMHEKYVLLRFALEGMWG